MNSGNELKFLPAGVDTHRAPVDNAAWSDRRKANLSLHPSRMSPAARMRPTRKLLLRAFFAYFAAISASGPGLHFWPALGFHGAHGHCSAADSHSGHCHHGHECGHHHGPATHVAGPTWAAQSTGHGHLHHDCSICQYYAQTQLTAASVPHLCESLPASVSFTLPQPLFLSAARTPYSPRGPPIAG